MSKAELTFTVTAFKAKCLNVFERIAAGEVARVTLTKRGVIVAEVRAASGDASGRVRIYGSMRGRATLPHGHDLTAPALEDMPHAAEGIMLFDANGEGLTVDGTAARHQRADLSRAGRADAASRPRRRRAG